MAVFKFSALNDGQSLVFNPTVDVLDFDQTTVAAADLRVTQVGSNIRIDVVSGTQTGKDVTLQNVSPLQLATTNVTFADGSKLLFGDNSTAQNDNLANSLTGTAGRDLLQGFGGADTLNGGAGNDTYIVGTGDVLSDTGGVDTVVSDISWTLADGFENLTLTGAGNISATGNNAANLLVGNSGDNFFNPRGGDDTIQAGAGNDLIRLGGGGVPTYGTKVIDGGAGFDTLDFGGFAKSAIVVDLAAGTLKGGGDAGQGSATLISIETVVGDAFDDRISGSGSTESLAGGGGNDTLDGRGGADTLTGGAGADTFAFSTVPFANDTDRVADFVSATDKLSFDNSVFNALGAPGNFAAGDARFASGAGLTSGQDASDRLIYNTTTGQLFFDADGNGAGASVRVATLQGAPALAATDIVVTGQSGSAIQGTEGNDTLTGTAGNDTIDGLGGNDLISGLAAADSLIGGAGNDSLDGGAGNDTLSGGLGADTFAFSAAPNGNTNADLVTDFVSGTDKLSLDNNAFTTMGPAGDFDAAHFRAGPGFTSGGSESDRLVYNTTTGELFYTPRGDLGGTLLVAKLQGAPALAASDIVIAGRGPIEGTPGNDSLTGTTADDSILGLGGNDTLDGVGGDDTLRGGDGDDTLIDHVNGGPDIPGQLLDGGLGNDTYDLLAHPFDGRPPAIIVDAGGVDTVLSNHGFVLPDGIENLTLFEGLRGTGNAQNNLIITRGSEFGLHQVDAREGNDTIISGSDRDEMTGGLGNDTFAFRLVPHPIDATGVRVQSDEVEDFASGADRLQFDNTAFTQLGALGNFTSGDARFVSGAGLTSGQDSSDRLVYDSTNGDLYYDADGNGAGASVLVAHLTGAPALAAADITVVGNAGAPGSNVQGTAGNDSLTGTEGNDSISGLAGNDTINALGGDDTLDGGAGVDNLNGGLGNDTYIVTVGDVLSDTGGIDTVMTDTGGWTLADGFENLTLVGTGNVAGTGNNAANVLIGNSGNNFFNPRGGDDTIQTGAGNDEVRLGGGGVPSYGTKVIDGGAGFDTLDFGGFAKSAIVVDLAAGTLKGGGDAGQGSATLISFETVVGDGFNDRISGSAVAESLDGGAGNDTLDGSGGADTLTGGLGTDTFAFSTTPGGANVDRVADFVSATDKLSFDNAAFTALGGLGNFAAGDARFGAGAGFTSGQDASDRLIYNTTTGQLFYDADGNGAGASLLVATLQGAPALVASDIVVTGQPGSATIQGTEGNDTLTGTPGNDTIDGRGGNDLISGLDGADSLIGGAGNDTLDGGAGADTMDGGLGDDTFVTTSRFAHGIADQLADAGGTDTLIVDGDGNEVFLPDGFENVTYRGAGAASFGDSELFGNAADNVIRNESDGSGFFMNGGAGNDTLIGSEHQDWFLVSAGNDVADGGADLDRIALGSAGVVDFRAGTATTASGSMTFSNVEGAQGGAGADRLVANDSGNSLSGGGGNDTILGGAGNDTLSDDFEPRSDSPTMPIGDDSISGGAGDDLIVVSRGNDTVQGDAGNDVIVINIFDVFNGSDTDSIDGGDGIDTLKVIGASATVDLAAGTFTDVNNASNHATFTSIENVTLDSAGPSLVSGTSGGNQLAGAFGDDTLNGRAGNDTLTGDRGDFAGPHAVGADHFVFDQTPGAANADVVTDFQSASDTLDLDASVMAQLGGSGRFGAGDGRFFAAAGATGGHDADDRVVYDTSTGNLYYDADGSGAGSGQLIATLQGASALTATDILVVGGAPAPGVHVVGTEGNDTLFGTNGSDTIDGLGGDDVLDGGAGIDVLHGGAGNDRLKDRDDSNLAAPDTLDGGLGDDIYDFLASPLRPHSTVIVDAGGIDTVWSNHDFVLPSGIENLTLFEGQVGTGNELGNMMVSNGNVGRYFMDGAGGNDTLAGAPDSFNNLTGGAGNDVFAFARPSNPTQGAFDTLSDFTSGADRLQFDNTGFTQIGAAGNFAPGDARFATTHGLHEGQDATDRLIYDIDSFNLYYDPDGNGSTQATLVAHLDGPRVLAATDIVVVGAGAPGGFVINGTAGNDSINGTEGNDSISGLAGNDTINALGGDDTLDGGAGIDNLNGGLGNDTYIVTVGDVLSDTGGIDTVITDVSGWTLADGFENLTLSGTANIAGTGNNAANVLTGNSGNNFFNPRGGDDTILAGAGNDLIRLGGGGVPSYGNKVIDGGDGFDTLDFGGFAKSAISVDLGAGTLGGGGEAGQGTARLAGIEAVIGEGFNDALTGSAGADSLNGGAGNDFLSGGAGNDTLESGVGQDSLNGGAGQDSFVFRQAPLTSGGVDFLTDFTSGSDKLLFDNAAFTALGADGAFTVNDARFVTGTAARDASDRLIYDSTTGVLLYDPDGTGSMSAGQVATLVGHPALAATDISVI